MEVMKIYVTIAVCFLYFNYGQCFEPLTLTAGFAVVSGMAGVGYMAVCHFTECCIDDYIPADFTLLNRMLKDNLYGQHIAHDIVLNAIRSHVNAKEPEKALAMSFHGLPGTGKNYLANLIVKALYKKGVESNYVHYYKGRLRFPSDGLVELYKTQLRDSITKHLQKCKRSIFIFDEVEKIPRGILDVLVPFLDYHPNISGADPTPAIFIFLSNTGGHQIGSHLFQLWQDGKTRQEATLTDFERQLALAAFNENGGFYRSDTIESSLIDHYVPFLLLEKEHVKRCIIDAFQRRSIEPNDEQIEEAMTHLTFEPHPYNLYSTGGCKRVDQKVGYITYRDFYKH